MPQLLRAVAAQEDPDMIPSTSTWQPTANSSFGLRCPLLASTGTTQRAKTYIQAKHQYTHFQRYCENK